MGASTANSATLANVASSASTGVLQAANAARAGWCCYNDSSAILYIAFAATASTSAYTVQVAAGGFYEAQQGRKGVYTGVISGIWASANGNARVTEW